MTNTKHCPDCGKFVSTKDIYTAEGKRTLRVCGNCGYREVVE